MHAGTSAKIACQVGHSGRKGSTQLGWEDADHPLPAGNWPLMAASAIPWTARNTVPRAMDRADMARVTAQFAEATQRAAGAGFDMIELPAAHGHPLASFLSPKTNLRSAQYLHPLQN